MKDLNQLLGAPTGQFAGWCAELAANQLRQAGFFVHRMAERFPETWFRDIGAVVYYLNAVPWEIEDFSVELYHEPLHRLHQQMERDGGLTVRQHLFMVEARRP
jgi:hypothetical protein